MILSGTCSILSSINVVLNLKNKSSIIFKTPYHARYKNKKLKPSTIPCSYTHLSIEKNMD